MSTFEIWSRGQLLGETDLENHDEGMNVRSGRFRPHEQYFRVRSVFRLFSAALDLRGAAQQSAVAEYYRMRDELELTVRERGGAEVLLGTVHIVDLDDDMEIEIEVSPPS